MIRFIEWFLFGYMGFQAVAYYGTLVGWVSTFAFALLSIALVMKYVASDKDDNEYL